MNTLRFAELPDRSVLHLRGQNIGEFLQGQLTCDLRVLTATRCVAGAMCSVKGRVLADLWVVEEEKDHCLLLLQRSLAIDFAEHLRRYAQFSRISVEPDPRAVATHGLWGEERVLDAVFSGPEGSCIRMRTGPLLRTSRTTALAIVTSASQDSVDASSLSDPGVALQPGNADEWRAAQLRDGHYAIEAADQERFTPQALNFDLTGRVAFDKGCYTGQEVVARLHYKGESKKRLGVFACTGAAPLPLGSQLEDARGEKVGELLRWIEAPEGRAVTAVMAPAETRGEARQIDDGRVLEPIVQASS